MQQTSSAPDGPGTVHPFFADAPHPRIIAHRGFVSPGDAERGIVENTRVAFEAALAAGATHLESDCRLTRDGQVVLFHDTDLVRVLGDRRQCSEVTRDTLAGLLEPRGGLLTLEDALTEFPSARLNIDVKVRGAAEAAGRVLGTQPGRALITSFSESTSRRAMRTAIETSGGEPPAFSPGTRGIVRLVAALATRSERLIANALEGIGALQIPERYGPVRVLSRRLIDAAHRHGVEVHVWTVNDPVRMRELSGLGVDGFVTDRTDLAVAALR